MTAGNVKVRYVGLVQNVLGKRQDELSLGKSTTVGELLQLLVENYGAEFRHSVLRTTGGLRPSVTIQVGDRDIKELEGLDTQLPTGSEVTLFITGHPDPGG
ncbi:MAG: MoaD/ThiS family protein [Dehalococcoidia bacterium]